MYNTAQGIWSEWSEEGGGARRVSTQGVEVAQGSVSEHKQEEGGICKRAKWAMVMEDFIPGPWTNKYIKDTVSQIAFRRGRYHTAREKTMVKL